MQRGESSSLGYGDANDRADEQCPHSETLLALAFAVQTHNVDSAAVKALFDTVDEVLALSTSKPFLAETALQLAGRLARYDRLRYATCLFIPTDFRCLVQDCRAARADRMRESRTHPGPAWRPQCLHQTARKAAGVLHEADAPRRSRNTDDGHL